jgi:rfaE bifunctional protein nucleotidyltransferase chain/domain
MQESATPFLRDIGMPWATYLRLRRTPGVRITLAPFTEPFLCAPNPLKGPLAMTNSSDKVKDLATIVKIVSRARSAGMRVVTTNGCYDVLHPGHVATLEWAKAKGDLLVVGMDADASVRKNKGPGRPIIPAHDRALVLAGLASVDYVFVFSSKNPIPWLKKLKPEVHVKGKGSELDPRFAPEEKVVQAGGGKVLLAPKMPGRSTTDIINTIIKRNGEKR